MEDGKSYPVLSWVAEGDEYEEEEEEEWKTCHTIPSKRQNNGDAPAKKKLKMDSFCTSLGLGADHGCPTTEVLSSLYNHKRTIIHIDIDCFYAQVEMILNPSLQNKAVGIQQKHTIVTCNYLARERGLSKLMRLSDAKKICPDLVLVNGENLSKYRDFSKRVNDLLQKVTPNVERLGSDENFLDVTDLVETRLLENFDPSCLIPNGIVYADKEIAKEKICACRCHQRLAIGSHLAAQFRKKIFEEIGLTCCAGIAHNKLLAKLAGECNKPNKQTLLFPEFSDLFLRSLPARKIPGIGSSSSKRLQSMGINSVPELQACPLASLQSEFGEGLALTLKRLSHGIDDADVTASGAPKSMSEEDTYHQCSSIKEVKNNLQTLANNLILRLTDDIGCPLTIRLTIRRGIDGTFAGDRKESRQGPIPSHFSSSKLTNDQKVSILLSLALELFTKLVNIKQPFNVKLLNICLTNFQKPSKCGEKAFSSFFTSAQSKTKAIKCTEKYSERNCGAECQNDDKDNVSGSATKSILNCSEIKYPKNEVSQTFISSNSENNSTSNNLKVPAEGCANSLLDLNTPSKDQIASEYQLEGKAEKMLSSGNSKEMCMFLPSDVDPEVFHSLPVDVQRELIEQWKKDGKSPVQKKVQKQPKGLLKYFSKP